MASILKRIDRPEWFGDIDFGKVGTFLNGPCPGCGHAHQGILIENGVMCCRGCGHREDGSEPPKPTPKVKAQALPVRRSAPVRRSRVRAPRRRLAVRCGGRRAGDDGGGSSGESGGSSSDGPSPPPPLPRCCEVSAEGVS